MLQALLMFDHAGRLLVANRRMHRMFGVPDGALAPGMTYREVTDRVVVMNAGKEIFEGVLSDAIRNPRVIEVFLGQDDAA